MVAEQAITKERREAWAAISELFLDTEHTDESYQYICRRLTSSGFSLDELDTIYADEVAPVLVANTYSVAGVWSGFDIDWLEAEILKRRRNPNLWDRISCLHKLRRRWVTRSTIADWRQVTRLLESYDELKGR